MVLHRNSVPRFLHTLCLLLLAMVCCELAHGSESPTPPKNDNGRKTFSPIAMKDLPDFTKDVETVVTKTGRVHTNGLVSTINYKGFKTPKLAMDEDEIKLSKQVTGFRKDLELSVLWQPGKAPLAVVLLGFYQKKDHKLARAWQAYLYASGCHVLTFDSIFRHETNAALGHGVAGNLRQDAKAVLKLLGRFLEYQGEDVSTKPRERITSIRLLGTSYGGIVALNLFRCPESKAFPIDRTLILSTPIRTLTAARQLDRFVREDRPRFEFYLLKLIDGYTPEKPEPASWEESLMRAGIAYEFQGDLEDAVKENEKLYLKGLLDEFKKRENEPAMKSRYKNLIRAMKARHKQQLKDLERQFGDDEASKKAFKKAKKDMKVQQEIEKNAIEKKMSDPEDWSFSDFVSHMTGPYWDKKATDIWSQADLEPLLKDTPSFVQAVITADDPLNLPEELKAIRGSIPEPKLLVLPHGGHLGYAGTKWIRALIVKFFKPDPKVDNK